jgi:spermidine synthase
LLIEENKAGLTRKVLVYTLVFFFLSGMCGLIYQILWTRILSLLFGHTTFAIGTVITAFMGGLALGSYYFGRWADRESPFKDFLKKQGESPHLLAYGLMEASVGIYCLLTPLLFVLVEQVYLPFSALPFYALNILRFLLCASVLIIPTFLMGGTFPIISKFFIQNFSEFGSKLGRLYFINTIGAAAGSFAAGLYLLRILGLNATLQCAAVINIGIGILAYLINKNPGQRRVKTAGEEEAEKEKIPEALTPATARLIFVIFAFTGFASMIYEIAWTRALALALGSSIYAFSTMLTTFLLGIALGSMLFSRMARKRAFSAAAFGWLEIVTGIFCLLSIPLLGQMPLFFISIFPFVKGSYNLIILADFLLSFLVMIIPTILMGFVFPLVGRLYTQDMERLGRGIGNVYAVNTLGCIAGSFLASFVLIPFIGVQNSLRAAIVINLLSGLLVLYQHYSSRAARIAALSTAAAAVFLSGFMPGWNPAVMTSGSAVYANVYSGAATDFEARGKNILFYRDGISSTVSVHKQGTNVFLRVNGKTDASTGGDMQTQLMLGYLPMIHHPDPKDIFIIGLGSGITARAVLEFPGVRSVLCAELEPAVLEANRFFADFNGQVLKQPRFKVRIDDGRNALLASKEKYDVIISEPSNPWIAGVANLYTSEFYRIGKDRLREGGIFCQWFHLYSMNPADVKMVLKTFFSVFPHGTVWMTAYADLVLLGSGGEMVFDYARWNDLYSRSPAIRKSMDSIKVQAPDAVFSFFMTDAESLRPLFRRAYLNTDDMPILEFSAPRNLYEDTTLANLRGLFMFKREKHPPLRGFPAGRELSDHYYVAAMNQMGRIGAPGMSSKLLEEGLELYPRHSALQMIKAKSFLQSNHILKAERELQRLVSDHPRESSGYLELARLYRNQGFPEKADLMFEKAFGLDQGRKEEMNAEYIKFLMSREKYGRAIRLLDDLRTKNPDNIDYEILSGVVLMKTKNYPRALQLLQKALEKKPGRYDVMRYLFMIYRDQGDYRKVVETGGELYRKNPYDQDVMVEYGKALMTAGYSEKGREIMDWVAQLDPYNSRTIDGSLETKGHGGR